MINRNISGIQFKYVGSNPEVHHIRAYGLNGEEVGHFSWAKVGHKSAAGQHIKPGEITHVEVEKGLQKKGIASHMYNLAQAYEQKPLHSTNLSKSGRRFARSVGGPFADSNRNSPSSSFGYGAS